MKISVVCLLAALCAALFSACDGAATATPVQTWNGEPAMTATPADPGVLLPRTTTPGTVPALAAHDAQVAAALQQQIPILTLRDGLTPAQMQAQTAATTDTRFLAYVLDPQTHAPFRNEVFGIYPLRASDIVQATGVCAQVPCYRVEMYNYALNLTTTAVVNTQNSAVVAVNTLPNTQPDLPPALTQIAVDIATSAPAVSAALGFQPGSKDALMANTKTSLNNTRCERSQHLCVAPTFVSGARALWAVVDLTDGVLVGLRWTDVGVTGPAVTEKGLENDVITRQYCEKTTPLTRDGWSLNYILTSSDGLRVSEVRYNNTPVLDSAKLVDWHVSYSRTDGFGYSDAVGCPVFSQAAVIAVTPPRVEDIRDANGIIGFALIQEFWSELWPRPCNYYYEQRDEFYTDGRFRPTAMSIGRGCGNDGTYRPVTRIALAKPATFGEWNGTGWKDWPVEGWKQQNDTPVSPQGYQFRVADATGNGYYIAPGRGQFGDGGRGDNAYIYATLHHPDRDEGDSDMLTIGPCCNTDYHQGPEKFIEPNPEPISNSALVLWYVAQLKNDDTPGKQYCWAESVLEKGVYVKKEYPCVSGPMFVPITKAGQ